METPSGEPEGVKRICQLQVLSSADLDTGAHGGSDGAGTDILTLCSSGLSLHDSLNQGVHVLSQLLGAERHLAEGAVDDVGLVQTVLDLTSLDFLNSSALFWNIILETTQHTVCAVR